MRNWEECLGDQVQKRKPDIEQAKSLYKLAQVRKKDNNRREKNNKNVPLIVETYWEIIKQLLTASLKIDGYKSYSQDCLIAYAEEFYNFNKREINLMDELRKMRNDIDYRGKIIDLNYLERKEEQIKTIVTKLTEKINNKI